jgi:DNA processing protein
MPYLSAREKILLSEALGRALLASLRLGDVEVIVRRRLGGATWDPESWAAAASRDVDYLTAVGGSSYSYFDTGYPPILRETARPPFMLYVRGKLPPSDRPSIAIVGTRFPTGRGLDAAVALGMEAAAAGVPVISGLARGIDSAAHRGALAGGGITFAVLGRGVDEVYPQSNKDLASSMVGSGGGIVSEYAPGTPPSRWTFPERNRILAGLCRSTIVVEAPGGSGALISAAFALEEGRDVYVAASCQGGVRSAGSDALIADGAVTLASFIDIMKDWRCERSGRCERGGAAFTAHHGIRRRRMWRTRRAHARLAVLATLHPMRRA